jgi:hypothetical protein
MAPRQHTAKGAVPQPGPLSRENQARHVMAVLVNDVVADAMRLGLHDQAERNDETKDAPVTRRPGRQ